MFHYILDGLEEFAYGSDSHSDLKIKEKSVLSDSQDFTELSTNSSSSSFKYSNRMSDQLFIHDGSNYSSDEAPQKSVKDHCADMESETFVDEDMTVPPILSSLNHSRKSGIESSIFSFHGRDSTTISIQNSHNNNEGTHKGNKELSDDSDGPRACHALSKKMQTPKFLHEKAGGGVSNKEKAEEQLDLDEFMRDNSEESDCEATDLSESESPKRKDNKLSSSIKYAKKKKLHQIAMDCESFSALEKTESSISAGKKGATVLKIPSSFNSREKSFDSYNTNDLIIMFGQAETEKKSSRGCELSNTMPLKICDTMDLILTYAQQKEQKSSCGYELSNTMTFKSCDTNDLLLAYDQQKEQKPSHGCELSNNMTLESCDTKDLLLTYARQKKSQKAPMKSQSHSGGTADAPDIERSLNSMSPTSLNALDPLPIMNQSKSEGIAVGIDVEPNLKTMKMLGSSQSQNKINARSNYVMVKKMEQISDQFTRITNGNKKKIFKRQVKTVAGNGVTAISSDNHDRNIFISKKESTLSPIKSSQTEGRPPASNAKNQPMHNGETRTKLLNIKEPLQMRNALNENPLVHGESETQKESVGDESTTQIRNESHNRNRFASSKKIVLSSAKPNKSEGRSSTSEVEQMPGHDEETKENLVQIEEPKQVCDILRERQHKCHEDEIQEREPLKDEGQPTRNEDMRVNLVQTKELELNEAQTMHLQEDERRRSNAINTKAVNNICLQEEQGIEIQGVAGNLVISKAGSFLIELIQKQPSAQSNDKGTGATRAAYEKSTAYHTTTSDLAPNYQLSDISLLSDEVSHGKINFHYSGISKGNVAPTASMSDEMRPGKIVTPTGGSSKINVDIITHGKINVHYSGTSKGNVAPTASMSDETRPGKIETPPGGSSKIKVDIITMTDTKESKIVRVNAVRMASSDATKHIKVIASDSRTENDKSSSRTKSTENSNNVLTDCGTKSQMNDELSRVSRAAKNKSSIQRFSQQSQPVDLDSSSGANVVIRQKRVVWTKATKLNKANNELAVDEIHANCSSGVTAVFLARDDDATGRSINGTSEKTIWGRFGKAKVKQFERENKGGSSNNTPNGRLKSALLTEMEGKLASLTELEGQLFAIKEDNLPMLPNTLEAHDGSSMGLDFSSFDNSVAFEQEASDRAGVGGLPPKTLGANTFEQEVCDRAVVGGFPPKTLGADTFEQEASDWMGIGWFSAKTLGADTCCMQLSSIFPNGISSKVEELVAPREDQLYALHRNEDGKKSNLASGTNAVNTNKKVKEDAATTDAIQLSTVTTKRTELVREVALYKTTKKGTTENKIHEAEEINRKNNQKKSHGSVTEREEIEASKDKVSDNASDCNDAEKKLVTKDTKQLIMEAESQGHDGTSRTHGYSDNGIGTEPENAAEESEHATYCFMQQLSSICPNGIISKIEELIAPKDDQLYALHRNENGEKSNLASGANAVNTNKKVKEDAVTTDAIQLSTATTKRTELVREVALHKATKKGITENKTHEVEEINRQKKQKKLHGSVTEREEIVVSKDKVSDSASDTEVLLTTKYSERNETLRNKDKNIAHGISAKKQKIAVTSDTTQEIPLNIKDVKKKLAPKDSKRVVDANTQSLVSEAEIPNIKGKASHGHKPLHQVHGISAKKEKIAVTSDTTKENPLNIKEIKKKVDPKASKRVVDVNPKSLVGEAEIPNIKGKGSPDHKPLHQASSLVVARNKEQANALNMKEGEKRGALNASKPVSADDTKKESLVGVVPKRTIKKHHKHEPPYQASAATPHGNKQGIILEQTNFQENIPPPANLPKESHNQFPRLLESWFPDWSSLATLNVHMTPQSTPVKGDKDGFILSYGLEFASIANAAVGGCNVANPFATLFCNNNDEKNESSPDDHRQEQAVNDLKLAFDDLGLPHDDDNMKSSNMDSSIAKGTATNETASVTSKLKNRTLHTFRTTGFLRGKDKLMKDEARITTTTSTTTNTTTTTRVASDLDQRDDIAYNGNVDGSDGSFTRTKMTTSTFLKRLRRRGHDDESSVRTTATTASSQKRKGRGSKVAVMVRI